VVQVETHLVALLDFDVASGAPLERSLVRVDLGGQVALEPRVVLVAPRAQLVHGMVDKLAVAQPPATWEVGVVPGTYRIRAM